MKIKFTDIELAFEFVDQYLSDDFERIRYIFRRRGAYARYKDLLEEKSLLKYWYDFENARQTKALRERCKNNDIMLIG